VPITFLLVDQSLPIFSFNRGVFVVDQLHFRFSLCGSVPEIFVTKVESCEKSRQILDVYALPNVVGAAPKSHTLVITPALQQVTWKSFVKLLPLVPKL